jgi:hypothetical protein
MKINFNCLLALLPLIVLTVSGCSSVPVSIKEAKQVSADRLMSFQTSDTGRTATLTVVRDGGKALLCTYGLWINQKLAARINTREFAVFQIEAGDILLRVGPDPDGGGAALCGGKNYIARETFMKPMDKKAFRVSFDNNGVMDIVRYVEFEN